MKKTFVFIVCCIILSIYAKVIAPIDDVFISTKQQIKKTISLNFVGDILAARAIEKTMRKHGYDYPFAKIQDELSYADITFANLETPLIGTATSGKTTVGGTTVFRGDTAFANTLKKAGIDIVSIANNHMKDQGDKGVKETILALDAAGVEHIGAGNTLDQARNLSIKYIFAEGYYLPIKVGYLAYNDSDVVPEYYHATEIQSGTNIMDIQRLKEDIYKSRPQVDVLIVSMHSGTEYITTHPNTRQTVFAHAAIDEGADFVIGHHPHVLQPMEIYKEKYIFYSLGNFIFDQPWPDTKESVLLKMNITLTKDTENDQEDWKISTYSPSILPLVIQDFQPQKTSDISKQKQILDKISISKTLFSIGGKSIFVDLATTHISRVLGLSGKTDLPKETGLLFVFDSLDKNDIWMKDMLFPIDIYWFDEQFNLIDKKLSVSTSTYPDVFYSKYDSMYVLETQEGLLGDLSLTEDLTGQLTLFDSYDKR